MANQELELVLAIAEAYGQVATMAPL